MKTFTITSPEQWQEVVAKVLPELQYPVLLLKGNLGAGKTTFTQYLMKALGSSDDVSSPTYAIVNEYHTPKGLVFHFDLYRMKDVNEVYDIGMDEYLDRAFLSIIEWPEIYEDELQHLSHHMMTIENSDGSRTINFE